jgi:hypothetical protein
MSYDMRIGDTRFYLVETMATSEDGRSLLGLLSSFVAFAFTCLRVASAMLK